MIVTPVLFLNPSGERGSLVVQKNSAVLDGGFALEVPTRANEKGFLRRDRHIRPPVPRGDADLFGNLIEAVDRSVLVASRDDESRGHSGKRIGDGLDEVRLPLALERGRIDLVLADQSVEESASAERSDNHHPTFKSALSIQKAGRNARDPQDVAGEIVCRAGYSRVVVPVDRERRRGAVLDEDEIAWLVFCGHETVMADSETRFWKEAEGQQKRQERHSEVTSNSTKHQIFQHRSTRRSSFSNLGAYYFMVGSLTLSTRSPLTSCSV